MESGYIPDLTPRSKYQELYETIVDAISMMLHTFAENKINQKHFKDDIIENADQLVQSWCHKKQILNIIVKSVDHGLCVKWNKEKPCCPSNPKIHPIRPTLKHTYSRAKKKQRSHGWVSHHRIGFGFAVDWGHSVFFLCVGKNKFPMRFKSPSHNSDSKLVGMSLHRGDSSPHVACKYRWKASNPNVMPKLVKLFEFCLCKTASWSFKNSWIFHTFQAKKWKIFS